MANKYHIDSEGSTVNQYGMVYRASDKELNRIRKVRQRKLGTGEKIVAVENGEARRSTATLTRFIHLQSPTSRTRGRTHMTICLKRKSPKYLTTDINEVTCLNCREHYKNYKLEAK
jgi:hypothetical protein